MNLESLYLIFKSKGADQVLKDVVSVKNGVKELGSQLAKLIPIGLSIGSIGFGLKNAFDYGAQLSISSKLLGVNAAALDMWGNAVRSTGGTIEGFESSLTNFAGHIGTTQNMAIKLLPQLSDLFQKMGRFRSFQYGKMLGLDENTILLLQQGRREVDELLKRQKELGTLTKENTDVFFKFRSNLIDTGHAFRILFVDLEMTVLPVIGKILNGITDFAISIHKHSDVIEGALIPIAAILGVIAVEFLVINRTVTLVIAAIGLLSAAFAVIFEDIRAFEKGAPSLIGDIDKKLGVQKKIGNFKENLFKGIFSSDLSGRLVNLAFTKDPDSLNPLAIGKKALIAASQNPLTSQTSNSILNNNNASNRTINLKIDDITINTQSTDPEGIASGLTKELQRQMRQAQNNFATGVAI